MKLTLNYLEVANDGTPGRVQVACEDTLGDGTLFRDSLYYSSAVEARTAISSGAALASAGERVARYLEATGPSQVALPPEPTKEELAAEVEALQALRDSLDTQIEQSQQRLDVVMTKELGRVR